jgi:DNA-binding transcriptional ArsR family regulator
LVFDVSFYICADFKLIMPSSTKYTFPILEAATESLRALAHPHRILIVEMLHRNKEMNVTEIYEELGIEQAVASHNLRILKDRGIVTVRRDGKNSYYALTSETYPIVLLQLLEQLS